VWSRFLWPIMDEIVERETFDVVIERLIERSVR
jgi:hypothetical protein